MDFGGFGNPFLYWTLKSLLLIILFYVGYQISFKDKEGVNYWRNCAIAIVAYSLEIGLRWNRSYDYPHYYQDLTGRLYTDYSDILYLWWIDIFKASSLPFWVAFIFYSFILIFGFCLVMKHYRQYAYLALPLLMLIPGEMVENHIRQFFAFAFILIGYYYLLEKKYSYNILFFLIAIGIHNGIAFAAVFIYFVEFTRFDNKFLSKPLLLICGYLAFYFIWETANLDGFAQWIGERLQSSDDINTSRYLDNVDYWLTDESNITEKLENVYGVKGGGKVKLYYIVMQQGFICGILYFGQKLASISPKFRLPLWVYVFTVFMNIFGSNNEIFSRFNSMIYVFYAFLIPGIMSDVEMKPIVKKLCWLLLFYFFIYSGFIRQFFVLKWTGYQYIWDM